MVVAWERDHDLPNPYVVIKSGALFSLDATFIISSSIFAGVTEADVKLALSEHEAQLVADGVPSLHDKVSASAFIVGGLNLQEQMCVPHITFRIFADLLPQATRTISNPTQ